jgi:predicted GIY-YIG superfamily endonuclease
MTQSAALREERRIKSLSRKKKLMIIKEYLRRDLNGN